MTKVVREVHHMIPNGHSLDYIPYTLGVSSSSTSSSQPNNPAHMSESGLYIFCVLLKCVRTNFPTFIFTIYF